MPLHRIRLLVFLANLSNRNLYFTKILCVYYLYQFFFCFFFVKIHILIYIQGLMKKLNEFFKFMYLSIIFNLIYPFDKNLTKFIMSAERTTSNRKERERTRKKKTSGCFFLDIYRGRSDPNCGIPPALNNQPTLCLCGACTAKSRDDE